MNRNTILLVIFLTLLVVTVGFLVIGKKTLPLVSSVFKQVPTQSSSPQPSTPLQNPPKEIKYDSSTDLKQELDSVDPKVLESDFKDLQDLTGSLQSP